MRRVLGVVAVVAALLLVGAAPAVARPVTESVELPDGFSPEGIAIGAGQTFYVGSLRDGDIYRGDLRSGGGELFVDAPSGRVAVGLKADVSTRRLFVAGGATGQAFIYDLNTGRDLGAITLAAAPGATFINDVVVTADAAWFTDSARAVLYRLPLLRGGGIGAPEVLALSGPGAALPGQFNLNGIEATSNGKTLIVVHSTLAAVFTVNTTTGATALIELGQSLPNGDGLVLSGRQLWVVQNFLNQLTEIRLAPDLSSGTVRSTITDPLLRIPTTAARHGNRLAVVNARFDLGIPGPLDADYDVVVLRP
jgi:hypothetical protein